MDERTLNHVQLNPEVRACGAVGLGPLQVVHEVEEGAALGVGTGLQQGQHGDQTQVPVLDVWRGHGSHAVELRGLQDSFILQPVALNLMSNKLGKYPY